MAPINPTCSEIAAVVTSGVDVDTFQKQCVVGESSFNDICS